MVAVVNPDGVHLAVDARLSHFDRYGRLIKWIDSSPKLTHLRYPGLYGCVSWAGVGAIGQLDTADWLAETLHEDRVGESPSLETILGQIAVQAEEHHRQAPGIDHSFFLAAVHDGSPAVAVVSNAGTLDEPFAKSTKNFRISKSDWRRRVVIAGSGRDFITKEHREEFQLLRSMAKHRVRRRPNERARTPRSDQIWSGPVIPRASPAAAARAKAQRLGRERPGLRRAQGGVEYVETRKRKRKRYLSDYCQT